MKKSLLALAALTAFAGAASAQSSVTLFGVVDLSVNSVKNGSTTLKSMDPNQLGSNRLGFRGVEDLGGGMSAGFWLEAGMQNDVGGVGGSNGLASVMFNRRSTVSLNGKFGEIRLGRDYTPTFWNTAVMDAYGANGWGEGADLMQQGLGSGAQTVRVNNAVSYWLPSMGGLYGEIQISAQESAITSAYANKYRGGKLGYAAGPLDVVVGYSSVTTFTSDNFVVENFGISYDFGAAKVLGLMNKNSWGSKSVTAYELSTSIPVGAGAIVASWTHANRAASGVDGSGSASQLGLEYMYSLSKRTTLYTQYGRISNSGKAGYTFGLGAITAADAAAGGFTSTAIGFGIKHNF